MAAKYEAFEVWKLQIPVETRQVGVTKPSVTQFKLPFADLKIFKVVPLKASPTPIMMVMGLEKVKVVLSKPHLREPLTEVPATRPVKELT